MPFQPLRDGLRVVLRLLRESGQTSAPTAQEGNFQQVLGGKQYHLLRLRMDLLPGAIPEVSANKYHLWVRFTSQDTDLRPRPFEGDVPFELTLCNF